MTVHFVGAGPGAADLITLRLTFVLTGTTILAIVSVFVVVRLRHRAAAMTVELG
jgi:precorrin-4 methylase